MRVPLWMRAHAQDHESSTAGRDSPGPGNYQMQPSTGNKQPQSNLHTASAWGFGTSSRFAKANKHTTTPGPGSYVI